MHVVLIQPRSPWGEHPYLPNGLLSVAARCLIYGASATILDENLGDRLDDPEARANLRRADVIGIGVLGSPYIPEALRVGKMLRACGYTQPIAIGGEVIMRLTPVQFERIFGALGDARQIASDEALNALLGGTSLRVGPTPTMYNTSMGPVIRALSDRARRAYFGREWCLFTSQGCQFKCKFCAASKGRAEQFRSLDAFADEVEALAQAVKDTVGARAPHEVYCSTLDGCQTPGAMDETLRLVHDTCRRIGTDLRLRFLATAARTVSAEKADPGRLRRWRGYGLGCIGIGVDGDDPGVWQRERKQHNTASLVAASFDLIAAAGIRSEALMVIGLPGDDLRAIYRGARACFRFARQGVTPRPYLGKAHAPGSQGWEDGSEAVERFLRDPELFRELDYGGLASPATHSDRIQRWGANLAFFATAMTLKAISPTGCPTQPLMPTRSVHPLLAAFGKRWNELMPGDR